MKKTKSCLRQLNRQHKLISKKEFSIRKKIHAEEDRIRLPKMKRKYEGKYFKFDNGFNNEDRWANYAYCRKVKDRNYGIFDSFESQHGGNDNPHIFHVNQERTYGLCQTRITKGEYEQALWNFLENILKMKIGERSSAQVFAARMKKQMQTSNEK